MDIITQVRVVGSKCLQAVLLVFVVLSFSNCIKAIEYSFIVFSATMILFFVMVKEDFYHRTVDVRRALFLIVGLLFVSRGSAIEILCTIVFVAAMLRMAVIVPGLYNVYRYRNALSKPEDAIDTVRDNELLSVICFLPCFAAGMIGFSVWMIFSGAGTVTSFSQYITVYGELFSEIIHVGILIWGIIWMILEVIYHWVKRCSYIEMMEGIGLGDVLVLPFFAGMMGIAIFSIVFVLGLCCAIFVCYRKTLRK